MDFNLEVDRSSIKSKIDNLMIGLDGETEGMF